MAIRESGSMTNRLLQQFAKIKRGAGDISFADVRKLQGEILPQGIVSPDEAEILIALDRAITRSHPAWAGYLVTSVLAFLLSPQGRSGDGAGETARQLAGWLSGQTTNDPQVAGRKPVRR